MISKSWVPVRDNNLSNVPEGRPTKQSRSGRWYYETRPRTPKEDKEVEERQEVVEDVATPEVAYKFVPSREDSVSFSSFEEAKQAFVDLGVKSVKGEWPPEKVSHLYRAFRDVKEQLGVPVDVDLDLTSEAFGSESRVLGKAWRTGRIAFNPLQRAHEEQVADHQKHQEHTKGLRDKRVALIDELKDELRGLNERNLDLMSEKKRDHYLAFGSADPSKPWQDSDFDSDYIASRKKSLLKSIDDMSEAVQPGGYLATRYTTNIGIYGTGLHELAHILHGRVNRKGEAGPMPRHKGRHGETTMPDSDWDFGKKELGSRARPMRDGVAYTSWADKFRPNNAKKAKAVSEYAASEIEEYVAESFVAYLTGEHDLIMPEGVKVLEDIISFNATGRFKHRPTYEEIPRAVGRRMVQEGWGNEITVDKIEKETSYSWSSEPQVYATHEKYYRMVRDVGETEDREWEGYEEIKV